MPPSATSEAAVAASDAGPLMALGTLERLDLLPRLFRRTLVPQAVLAECLARPELDDARAIRAAADAGAFEVLVVAPIEQPALGPGERSAIALAQALGALLLIDDRAARRHAEAIGLRAVGTLGLLVRAKRRGWLTAVAPCIDRLHAAGRFLSPAAVDAALAAAGERPGA